MLRSSVSYVPEKVKEKPDPNSKPAIDFDSKVTAERDKQIKVRQGQMCIKTKTFFR